MALLVLDCLALATPAQAAGAHSGGARPCGGGAKAKHQVNNNKVDARSNNVRKTSVNRVNNNVSVNKNTNVNVSVDRHGGHNNGWDNDCHPIATAAAVTATVAITAAVVGSTSTRRHGAVCG